MTAIEKGLRTLAREVRTMRADFGMSLRDVERESGVAFNTVARLERGQFQVRSIRAVAKLADWCGLELVLRPKGEA